MIFSFALYIFCDTITMEYFVETFLDYIKNNNEFLSRSQTNDRSPLVFAFVGDAVFSLFVRTYLADLSTAKAGILHTETSKFVRASYQKKLLEMLKDLSQDELQIITSARNAKTNNVAKNSNLEEYKKSTSFEALLGYLYLTNQFERLKQILDFCEIQMEKDL